MLTTYTANAASIVKWCRVCLSQRQRAQQSHEVAGDAHFQLHMSRRPRKCWSDCKEVQHTCLNSHQHYTVHGHSLHFTAGPLYCFVNTCRFRHLYIEINQLICLWIIIALVYAVIAVACHLCVTCVVERAKTWDDIVRSLCISASSLVPFWLMCHCVLSGHFAMQHSVHKHFLYKKI